MNKDKVQTVTCLYYSVINHLAMPEMNSNASLHTHSAEIDFCKPQKNNERCNMIKINGSEGCPALKYLRGVNIYQQSVTRQNTSHQGYSGEKYISP